MRCIVIRDSILFHGRAFLRVRISRQDTAQRQGETYWVRYPIAGQQRTHRIAVVVLQQWPNRHSCSKIPWLTRCSTVRRWRCWLRPARSRSGVRVTEWGIKCFKLFMHFRRWKCKLCSGHKNRSTQICFRAGPSWFYAGSQRARQRERERSDILGHTNELWRARGTRRGGNERWMIYRPRPIEAIFGDKYFL